jgi:hypothetical protein
MSEKVKNYPDEAIAELVAGYKTKEGTNKEFVAEMAEVLGHTTKSIVAKLVSLKIYQAEPKATKTGEPVISKKELVAQIETGLGLEVPSLIKATKADLQNLVNTLG